MGCFFSAEGLGSDGVAVAEAAITAMHTHLATDGSDEPTPEDIWGAMAERPHRKIDSLVTGPGNRPE